MSEIWACRSNGEPAVSAWQSEVNVAGWFHLTAWERTVTFCFRATRSNHRESEDPRCSNPYNVSLVLISTLLHKHSKTYGLRGFPKSKKNLNPKYTWPRPDIAAFLRSDMIQKTVPLYSMRVFTYWAYNSNGLLHVLTNWPWMRKIGASAEGSKITSVPCPRTLDLISRWLCLKFALVYLMAWKISYAGIRLKVIWGRVLWSDRSMILYYSENADLRVDKNLTVTPSRTQAVVSFRPTIPKPTFDF